MTTKLDLHALCANEKTLSGEVGAEHFVRLGEDGVRLVQPLHWRVTGGRVKRGQRPEYAQRPALTLTIHAQLELPCARCLEVLPYQIEHTRRFILFDSEAQADLALIDDDEFDALVEQTPFDILSLVEDELLLSLDPPPRHSLCELGDFSAKSEHPFDILSKLRS